MTTDVLPDDDVLRLARRARVLAEMDDAGVDILVLGREANARYVAGAPRLWLAGTRPYGPGCVLVRETGSVYLLTTWDEGVAEDIPHEHLYGITFNASNFIQVLSGVDGAATATTVATDAMSPGAAKLLAQSFPAAEVVDGETLLQRARSIKTPEEITEIRAAVGVAERSLAAAVAATDIGVTEQQLAGSFMGAMAAQGVTTPSVQDVAWITSRTHPWRRSSRATAVGSGDLVAFDAGVIRGGYVGELGRTVSVDGGPAVERLMARRDELWRRLVDVCRPGRPVTDLLDVYDAAGVAPPPMPVARGLGLGYDMPMVSHALPATAAAQRLEPGMVLAVAAYVWAEGVGAAYGQEPVLIGADGPQLLSTDPFC